MAKSQQTFEKKEREKKRLKKRRDKQEKKEERRANAEGGGLDNMMAYLDENGNLTTTPPDPTKVKEEIDPDSIVITIPKKEFEEVVMRTGRIEFFNDSKGYGFIKEAGTNEKFFVHINGLIDEVVEGDKVEFDLERGLKGLNAVRVKKI